MKPMAVRIILGLVLLGLWILLTLPFSLEELLVGAGVAMVISLLPLPSYKVYKGISFLPKKVWYSILYLWVFARAVVRSNLDVAYRVLSPRLPINPGIVKVKTKLKSPLGRLILANSITLTPGTITVDMQEEDLFIHWLSVESPDIEENTQKIVGGFEKYLEVIFG